MSCLLKRISALFVPLLLSDPKTSRSFDSLIENKDSKKEEAKGPLECDLIGF